MHKQLEFQPLPLFACPHRQTIGGSLFHFDKQPVSITHPIPLPDGDKITIEITTPVGWKQTDRTVLLVHGLAGCHDSVYLIRLVNRLEPQGIRCIRFNMRGCGSGKGLAQKIYHSGSSDDLHEALKYIHAQTPDSPTLLVAFSLGANVSLKLSGELGCLGSKYLKGVVAISPPADISPCIDLANQALNGFYERHFCNILKTCIAEIHKTFDLPPFEFPENLTFREFDRIYKIPKCGFKSADHYYQTCSAKMYVSKIGIPCRILFAEDDPLIAHTCLDSCNLPSNVELYKTKMGGHIGFLGDIRHERGFRWLDSLLEDWIKELL